LDSDTRQRTTGCIKCGMRVKYRLEELTRARG
jgi:hypothetical protein